MADEGKATSNAPRKHDGDVANTLPVIAPYLPRVLLDTLCNRSDLRPVWIEPVEGSLLFADISGFTRMSERLAELGKEGAERLTEIVNDYFGRMLDIAGSLGGDNVKFGGDALLLLFAGDNHARRAVAAALAMVHATSGFKAVRIGKDRFHLNMSAGVNSGKFWSASAGLPGIRMQHLLLGREASRVAVAESQAEAGEVVITTATGKILGDRCVLEERGEFFRVLRLVGRTVQTCIQESNLPRPLAMPNLFSYLPPPIVRALTSGDEANRIEGEHRKVTVQFINVMGINELLDAEGPDALMTQLQQYVSSVVELVDKHEGFLAGSDIDVQGLKLILAFGAPVAHEYDSANALRLALELNTELSRFNLRLRHRIGIHTGFVFTGEVGSPRRRDYTVMGDAVNLAARLMGKASPGQILVSGRLADEVGAAFKVRQLPPMTMKGKTEPVPACELEGEADDVLRQAAKAGSLFGRDKELEELRQTCLQAEAGNARSIVITGEAGIGKSVLLAKFQEYLTDRGWTVHRGHCNSHTSSNPLVPWVGVLNSLFGMGPAEDIQVRTQKVIDGVNSLASNLAEITPLFNALLSVSIPQTDVVRSLDDEARRRRLFGMVTDLFKASATSKPVAVVIEDLQWADRSSLKMISHVAKNLKSCPFLLCLTHRPKAELGLELPPDSTQTVPLGELPQGAAMELVLASLNRNEVPESVIESILSKARGNPLYLEQISRSLRQSGILDRLLQVPAFRLAQEMAALDVPDQLQALIMSRIDSLGSAARDLLRVATVIGITFDARTLSSVLDTEPGEAWLAGRLQELELFDFIQRVEDDEKPSYQFKHSLIQETAYDSLLFARRRQLHGRVAVYLEATSSGEMEPLYETLLHHYSRCGDSPKTVFFGIKAGDKARRLFAHEEALAYYRRALDAVSRIGDGMGLQRSYIMERIGNCYESSGGHLEAARAYSRALRQWTAASRNPAQVMMAPELDDSLPLITRKSALQHKIGIAYERNCQYDLALKHLETASRELPTTHLRQTAGIAVTKSLTYYRKGLLDEAIHWGQTGLSLSRRNRDKQNLAYAYNILANSYVDRGQIKRGILYRRLAIRLYEETGNLSGQAEANNNLGVAFQSLGNQEEAFRCFLTALTLCERIGNFANVAIAHNNVGEVLLVIGRLDEAIGHLLKVVETYEQKGEPAGCSGLAMVNLSRAYQRKGEYEKALESVRRGVQVLRKVGARGFVAEGALQEAELELEMGHAQIALRLCQGALREAKEQGMKTVESRGLRIMGRIRAAMGDYTRAEADLRDSVALARNAGGRYEEGLSLLSLAELYQRYPEVKWARRNARAAVRRAVSIFSSLRAEGDLEKSLQMQASLDARMEPQV